MILTTNAMGGVNLRAGTILWLSNSKMQRRVVIPGVGDVHLRNMPYKTKRDIHLVAIPRAR